MHGLRNAAHEMQARIARTSDGFANKEQTAAMERRLFDQSTSHYGFRDIFPRFRHA
jgi:hypothetical protein